MDAARYGIKVTLVEDCLGYRRKDRHEQAMKQLHEIMEADICTSTQVIERLKNPPQSPEEDPDYEPDGDDEEEVSVGEDAEGNYLDLLLEADSADEEDHLPPIVRPSHTRSLAHRYASSTISSLPEVATAGPEPLPPFKPSQSPSTRAPDPSGTTVDDHGPASIESNESGKHGKRENSLERWITHTTHIEGVAGDHDESSGGVTSNTPRDKPINQMWREQDKQSYLLSGRSTHPGLNAISVLCGLDQSTVNDMEGMMNAARLNHSLQDSRELNARPLFGDGKEKESGGSRILFDLLPLDMADTIFEELNHEVKWQKMYHQTGEVPRLVCCQGSIDEDGSMPVYRHPSDFTLPIESWTPAVDRVRKAAEQVIGHPLNHALIQLYRGGTDFISEHSDKTLDIVKDSFIVNISFGAQRKMRLRTKRSVAVAEASPGESTSSSRTTYRIPMPHNSIITMSLPTNAEYLHGINADKRPAVELTDAEKAFDAQRISLTFRNIGTFLDKDSNRIWGQGATGKAKDEAKAVINANAAESEKLVRAFGAENQSSHVDWDAIYGDGFDVLHLK
jgi:alkylated DNA repair dioxygenase AlkB